MEVLRIWCLCIGAAILYGLVHDQVTAHLCVAYFLPPMHPLIVDTHSPVLLALTWGVIATWWMGAIIGYLLVLAARLGRWPKLTARDLTRPLGLVLAGMAACALVAGIVGFCTGHDYPTFNADLWAHTASYFAGGLGGLALCVWTLLRRRWLSQHPEAAGPR
jgi:hypothetical protein